ncbi:MAG: MerR family transcriptional regulator, partial [Syntrophales bacterium]|nr:MerR family transcriptional regulator [Syntrophales bacterium]
DNSPTGSKGWEIMPKKPAAHGWTVVAVDQRKNCTISKLGRLFGLSRSALLYYDRIGLLTPSGRTQAGYRCYSEADRLRLERICGFRRAGLALEEIRIILASGKPSAAVLERRFHEIGEEISILKVKQGLLSRMLTGIASAKCPSAVDRDLWVEMLRAAGMDDRAMARWHAEFEQRAPEAHREFLLSLGITEEEALEIRNWSRLTVEKDCEKPADPDDQSRR